MGFPRNTVTEDPRLLVTVRSQFMQESPPAARSRARDEAPNTGRALIGEPQVAIRPDRDTQRPAAGPKAAEEAAAGRDLPNAVGVMQREPEVAIGTGRDAVSPAEEISPALGQGERGDDPRRGHASDLVAIKHREPEVAVRSGRDARSRARNGEHGDGPTGRDAPDVAPIGEPQVAIRSDRDELGSGRACGERELGDTAASGDAPDLARGFFREPQVAIRSSSDTHRPAVGRGDAELRDGPAGGDAPDLARFT